MSPNVVVLLPLAGILLGLASSFVVVYLRPSSKAYSRSSYPVVMGFDLKLALLMTLMAMVVFMLASAGYPLLMRRAVPISRPAVPIHRIPIDSIMHVMPPPPSVDPDKVSQLLDFKIPAKLFTLDITKIVPDDQAQIDGDMTPDQALQEYAQNTALSDSVLKNLLQSTPADGPLPGVFVAHDREPETVLLLTPIYPEICIQAKIEGTVYVQMLVDAHGQVARALVHRSSGNTALDEAAVEAAKGSRFRPAMQGSTPVSVWIGMPFTFKLTK